MKNYYFIDYEKYRLKVNTARIFNSEMAQKILQYFKVEFQNLDVVNVETVNNLLVRIHKSIKVRHNNNNVFVVTQQPNYICVSLYNFNFFYIYEK